MKRILGLAAALLIVLFIGVRSFMASPSPEPVQPAAVPTASSAIGKPGSEPSPETTEMPVIAVTEDPSPEPQTAEMLDEDGTYDTKEEVALYLYQYGKLPSNFMTKNQARKKGWSSGPLHLKVKGKCIGGDKYSNFEGLLPEKDGRVYYECDINTLHSKSRGPERIVYSNDGLIYYTPDHYESFELLYGEEMLQ